MQIYQKIETIKTRSRLLAVGVRTVLDVEFSENSLETIYIPFFSHFMVWDFAVVKRKLGDSCPQNLEELHEITEGFECRGEMRDFSYNIDNTECDLGLLSKPNVYEKIIYSIFRLSFIQINIFENNLIPEFKKDFNARMQLKEYFKNRDLYIFHLVDLIPLTLFEGLKGKIFQRMINFPKVHTLGPYYNESYLFSLAALRENNVKIIGMPHGGGFCQFEFPTKYEICERALTDFYLEPSWNFNEKVFPNIRVSRNLFLNLKNKFSKKNTKKNKLLVLLGYIYMDEDPRAINNVTGEDYQNVFYERQLKTLNDHFSTSFDFKLYVRQLKDKSILPTLDYLKLLYPGSEIIDEDSSVLELSRNYDGVVHLDTWGTAIMELSASNTPQYVYIGPDLRLRKDYEFFLWNIKKLSTKHNYNNGAYLLIDNLKYRYAYGASFLYPLYYVILIKLLTNKLKWNRLRLWFSLNFLR